MRARSLRWKLVLPAMSLATLGALLLVVIHDTRSREVLLGQLERSLATKCEEVHSLLGSGATAAGLEGFLEVGTHYISSPYEYFYEIVDGGTTVLASENLGRAHLDPGEADVAGEQTVPHPHARGESVRLHSEPLPPGTYGWREPRLSVAVSLRPFEEAVMAGLVQSLVLAAVGLCVLFVALWRVVGRTLQRVAAITRRASTITATNARERLPVGGGRDELDELASVFNEMLSGLGRAIEQMEAFTADAAHQFRTPLTRVHGQLDLVLAERTGLSANARARLEEAREELQRLAHTCTRLLLLARLDRGELEEGLLADEVDLGGLVGELAEQVMPFAGERGVDVRSSPCEGIHLRCSRSLLIEALLNLLDNALRVSPEGTAIEIAVRREGDEALLTVADQGPGIPEHLREQVFRRFFRCEASAADGGTGLGLAIARGIARGHGGELSIESAPQGGAAFVLRLPLGRRLRSVALEVQPALHRAG